MSMYQEINLKLLASYALLYVKVGKIELALRELIPATFSNPHINGDTHWGNLLIFNTSYKKTLSEYQKGREDRLPLPFSFWTSLFSYENYQKLWVPYLFSAFPNLKNPHSRKSFHIVNRLLFESRTIRNRVAHFDFPEGIDIEVDSRNLDELLRLLDR